MAKIGEGHAAAMGRLGLAELRNAFNPSRESVADRDMGLFGLATQGEIAQARNGPGDGPEQESLSMDQLRSDAREKGQEIERGQENDKGMQGPEQDRGRGRWESYPAAYGAPPGLQHSLCVARGYLRSPTVNDAQVGGTILLIILVVGVVIYVYCKIRPYIVDAELQRTNPELWHQKELLKLQKERLETERQLAEERAKQENLERNVGIGMAIGRIMGWW
jgi:hypothetical protein